MNIDMKLLMRTNAIKGIIHWLYRSTVFCLFIIGLGLTPANARNNISIDEIENESNVNVKSELDDPKIQVRFSAFMGAALYANALEGQSVEITLIQYWENSTPVPNTAYCSVFEALAGMPRIDIVLNQDSTFLQKNQNPLPCYTQDNPEYRVVVYTAKTELSSLPGGHNIVWQWEKWQGISFENIDAVSSKGLSLIYHLPQIEKRKENQLAQLQSAPFMDLCSAWETHYIFQTIDLDNDSVSVEFASALTAASNDMIEDNFSTPVDSGPYPLTIPPYIVSTSNKKYSPMNPFGKGAITEEAEIDLLKINVAKSGNYLVSLDIKEYRKGKVISTYPFVFISHVK